MAVSITITTPPNGGHLALIAGAQFKVAGSFFHTAGGPAPAAGTDMRAWSSFNGRIFDGARVIPPTLPGVDWEFNVPVPTNLAGSTIFFVAVSSGAAEAAPAASAPVTHLIQVRMPIGKPP